MVWEELMIIDLNTDSLFKKVAFKPNLCQKLKQTWLVTIQNAEKFCQNLGCPMHLMRSVLLFGISVSYNPHFPNIMRSRVAQLMGVEYKFDLMLSTDGSGRGAALVAAVLKNQRTPKIENLCKTKRSHIT
eukprot:TRINITY_DN11775_c0_g1_i1.p1 TRINITY_DN11775_c0_g1~~TRINITY_DN11775_c0_g1_i1.p1  ORF type:complete len:130 (-),score=15.16 TRINITY_DN11775_c0_g1_i1:31-420(-)